MSGALFVVATPIGNLEDLTFRALRTLKEVDLIAAEDTRRTPSCWRTTRSASRMVSLREHNEVRETPRLIARLQAGAVNRPGVRRRHARDRRSRGPARSRGAGRRPSSGADSRAQRHHRGAFGVRHRGRSRSHFSGFLRQPALRERPVVRRIGQRSAGLSVFFEARTGFSEPGRLSRHIWSNDR